MRVDIGRAKWFLWHGNHYRALQVLDDVAFILQSCDPTLMHAKATKLLGELVGYIEHNRHRIPSYAERRLAGEPISSAPAEGAVNQVIAKRMIKKQQMRWNPHGAHRLLQIRTRVLDHHLDDDIHRWHPAPPTRPLTPLDLPRFATGLLLAGTWVTHLFGARRGDARECNYNGVTVSLQ